MATPIAHYTHHQIPVFSADDAEIHVYPVHLSDGTVGYLQMVPPEFADRPALCIHHPTYGKLASAQTVDNIWPDPYARTIEDWEGSGGSFPSAWDPFDGHEIRADADLEHEDWGFTSNGRVGLSTSDSGLPLYPEVGTWFDFLVRFNQIGSVDNRMIFRFGRSPGGWHEVELRLNRSGPHEIQLDTFDSDGVIEEAIIPSSTSPDGKYQVGDVYRVAVYRGRPGETWRIELYRVNDDWSEVSMGTWSGTTSINYPGNGIAIDAINTGSYFSLDRIRRLPTNY